jgi:hypothetical protein
LIFKTINANRFAVNFETIGHPHADVNPYLFIAANDERLRNSKYGSGYLHL